MLRGVPRGSESEKSREVPDNANPQLNRLVLDRWKFESMSGHRRRRIHYENKGGTAPRDLGLCLSTFRARRR